MGDTCCGSRTPERLLKERTLRTFRRKRVKCGRACQMRKRRNMRTVHLRPRKSMPPISPQVKVQQHLRLTKKGSQKQRPRLKQKTRRLLQRRQPQKQRPRPGRQRKKKR